VKIKMTSPARDRERVYEAGLIYDLPPKQAQEYLDKDIAVLAEEAKRGNRKNSQ